MVIILKIFLAILMVAFGYMSYFIISEHSKFRKSEASNDASLVEKFTVGTIAFSSVVLMAALIVFSILMLFSTITITLPF